MSHYRDGKRPELTITISSTSNGFVVEAKEEWALMMSRVDPTYASRVFTEKQGPRKIPKFLKAIYEEYLRDRDPSKNDDPIEEGNSNADE
jgi:hypothetical protein